MSYKALLALFFSGCVYLGLPLVDLYHKFRLIPFFSVSVEKAQGLEKLGDQIFAPVHYLLDGKVAHFSEGKCVFSPRFSYKDNLGRDGSLSIIAFPPALVLGSLVKGLSFLDKKTEERYQKIEKALASTEVISNRSYYRSLGLSFPSEKEAEKLLSLGYQKKEEEGEYLSSLKEGLKSIIALLEENEIPYWVDCGTLLGAYRYGGVIPWDMDVDLAILLPDFHNVQNVLKKLDPKKFSCQDWSNRTLPATYLRVYVKKAHQHIDIYGFQIETEKQQIRYILSNGDSDFMKESWKRGESNFTKPHPYSEVFPLKRAQLDDMTVWVPQDTKTFLEKIYGKDLRPAKIFNAKTGSYDKDESHPYWKTHG